MRRIRRHTSPGVYTQITDISAFNMSKYKRFFHEKSDDIEINNGGNTPQPEPQPEPEKYLVFTAQEDNSTIGLEKLSPNQELEYSYTKDTNAEWTTFNTGTTIELTNNGDKVYIRGILGADNTSSDYTQFKMYGTIAASGNCNAIWDWNNLETQLRPYCGFSLFEGCTSLTEAHELELPATTLAEGCYRKMFCKCTSLTTAPKLLAETCSGKECCLNMFEECTSLTKAPELSPTTLSKHCYKQMFLNCTGLTEAPYVLPAETLEENCYESMFENCTSLEVAPELPATTLFKKSYYKMFRGCKLLKNIKCLATDISADDCTENWVNGVSSTGTFIKHPNMNNWSRGTSGIPSGNDWVIEDAVL